MATPVTRAHRTHTATAVLAPEVVLRCAGLPAGVLRRLTDPGMSALSTELADLRGRLEAGRDELSSTLYRLVGGQTDRRLRTRLLRARRDAFNLRPSCEIGWLLSSGSVPPAVAATLAAWQRDLDRYHDLRRTAARTVAAERERLVAELRRLADDAGFLAGLTLASPAFAADLLPWLADPRLPATARLTGTLYRYALRAAAKTSPFSTFMVTGLARWDDDGPPIAVSRFAPARTAEVNVAIADQLWRTLARWPALRRAARVRRSPGLRADGDVLRVLRAGENRPEALLTVTAPQPWLTGLLAGLAEDDGQTYGAVADRLAGATGWPESRAARALDRLVEVGVVEVVTPVPDGGGDHLGPLRDWLAAVPAADPDHHRAAAVCTALDAVRDSVRAHAGIDDAGRRLGNRERVDDELRVLYRCVGWDADCPDLPRRHTFYEDSFLRDPATVGRAGWAGIADTLGALRRIAGLYDWSLPVRRAATRWFTCAFGPGQEVDFLRFYEVMLAPVHAGADPEHQGLHAALGRPRAHPEALGCAEIAAVQRAVAEALHPPVTGDVWRIEPEHLVAAARHLPGWVPVPHSLAFFGQPLFAGRRLTGFVLNSVESGHGRAAGRAAWRVGADAATADTGPPGVCLAEVPATAGSNVNLRRVRAPAQLGYPGVPGRSGGECLRLVDLTVRHDPEVDRLVLRVPSSPHEVVPVHLGDMAEFLLPPAHRLLVQVFGDSPTSYLREALGGVLPGASARSPRRTPRVVVDDVVVQRAGVLLRAADLPQRLTDDDDVDHLLRAHAWRRAHGVPTRCFVRQLPPTPAADREFLGRKERKPVFLDLDSLLGLDLLHRAAGDPDALLMFQEALPDPVELPATVGGEPRVVELVVELR